MTNRLREIEALGQAVWIDNINRELLDDGILQRLVDEDGISGVTSNPTIFEKAMGHSERYDEGFKRVLDGDAAIRVRSSSAWRSTTSATPPTSCAPTYEATEGQDGYVSFELPPELAFDAAGSVEAAKRFHAEIGKDNVLIKVPGTAEGVEAFEELTAAGVSVNVTLLFDVRALRRDRGGLRPRPAAPRGRRRADRPHRVRRELLRLARRQQGRRRARREGRPADSRARPPSPTRGSPTRSSGGSSAATAGTRWRPRAPTCSARCGRRRRRRTRTTPTRSTSTS